MAEQRKRMTYEEQRALRERQRGERTADRYRIENYAGDRLSGAASPSSQTPRAADSSQSGWSAAYRRQSTTQRSTRQAASQRTASQRGTARRAGDRPASGASARQSRPTETTRNQFSRGNYGAAVAGRPPIFKIGIGITLVIAVALIVQLCSAILPITVTVNGSSYELRGAKTMQTAIKASGLPINPGDLISLNGSILEKSAGHPFAATVNNEETADPDYRLHDGDTISVTDGEDIVEDYDAVEQAIPFSSGIVGIGSIHEFSAGAEGVLEVRTGRISGETVERQTVAPENATCSQYNLNVGNDKVVAFTFDDGPSSEYTAEVLDILRENGAKATFFCIGTEVESYPNLVEREAAEGHQVCTHSYDHADPVGGTNIGFMDAAGQIDEIVHGMQTITDVLGGEASRVVRLPGGNLDDAMVLNLQPYIDYEIGWNIDTQDWTLPGADAIYEAMIGAAPGDVILCHDGGGDRSQTVEALRRALPYLKSKGFTFLTMDEMLEYPAAGA